MTAETSNARGELRMTDIREDAREPLQLLRERLCHNEEGWRALCQIMPMLAAAPPPAAAQLLCDPVRLNSLCEQAFRAEDGYGDKLAFPSKYSTYRDGFFGAISILNELFGDSEQLPAAARGDVRAVLQEMRDRQVARRFKSQTLIDWADRIESALAAEGVQAGEVEQRVPALATLRFLPGGIVQMDNADFEKLRIAAALSQQPEARGMVDDLAHSASNAATIIRNCVNARQIGEGYAQHADDIDAAIATLTEARNVR